MTQPTTPESGTPITDVAYLALDDECNQLKRDLTAALGREAKLRGEYSSTQKSLEDMHTRAESAEKTAAQLREELRAARECINKARHHSGRRAGGATMTKQERRVLNVALRWQRKEWPDWSKKHYPAIYEMSIGKLIEAIAALARSAKRRGK